MVGERVARRAACRQRWGVSHEPAARCSYAAVAFGALVVLLAIGCEEPPPEEAPPPPPPVHVATVIQEMLAATAEGTAEIEAIRSALIRAEAPGRVVALAAEAGQSVEAGELLVRLDVGRAATALQAARTGVAQAEAQLAQAERQRDLARRLVAGGSLPQQRLDDAEDGVRLAMTALQAARAQTAVTRRGLTEAVVRAPFDGTVVETLAEVGELATPGSPLLQLVDTSGLEARVLLDPARALDVPVGAQASLTAHARPGETFAAQVVRVGEVVDPRTRRLPVVVHIEDPDDRLRPGLTGEVSVRTGEPRPALVIPDDALFERYGEPHVFIVDGESTARRRGVVVDRREDGRALIAEGLEVGDRVVVAGLDRVVHEGQVTVVDAEAPPEEPTAAVDPEAIEPEAEAP